MSRHGVVAMSPFLTASARRRASSSCAFLTVEGERPWFTSWPTHAVMSLRWMLTGERPAKAGRTWLLMMESSRARARRPRRVACHWESQWSKRVFPAFGLTRCRYVAYASLVEGTLG